jgi:hypothetical protein
MNETEATHPDNDWGSAPEKICDLFRLLRAASNCASCGARSPKGTFCDLSLINQQKSPRGEERTRAAANCFGGFTRNASAIFRNAATGFT